MLTPKEIAQRLSGALKIAVDNFGIKRWYLNGRLHREDGPAVECVNGSKAWYINGKLHRADGPAIEYSDGRIEWWINDKFKRSEKMS